MSDDLRALRDAFPERPPSSASRSEARATLQATVARRRHLVRAFVIGGLAAASVGGLVLAIAMHRPGDPTVRIDLGGSGQLPAGSPPRLSTDRSQTIIASGLPISRSGRRTLRQVMVVDSDRGRYVLWTWRDADVSSKFGAMVGMTGPTNIGGDAGPCALQLRQLKVCSTIAVSKSGPPVVSGIASPHVATLRGRAADGADVPIVRRGQFWVAVPAREGTPDPARGPLREVVGLDGEGRQIARLDVSKRLGNFDVSRVETRGGTVYARGYDPKRLTYLTHSEQFIYLVSRASGRASDCLTVADRISGAVLDSGCESVTRERTRGVLVTVTPGRSWLLLPRGSWTTATIDGQTAPIVGGRIVELIPHRRPIRVDARGNAGPFVRRVYPPGETDPAQVRESRRGVSIPTPDGPVRMLVSTFETVKRSSLLYRGRVGGIAVFSGKWTTANPHDNDDCFIYVGLGKRHMTDGSIGCGLKNGTRGGSGYSESGGGLATVVQTMPRGPFVSATIDDKPLALAGRETYVVRGKPGERHEIRAVRPDGTVFRQKLRLGRP